MIAIIIVCASRPLPELPKELAVRRLFAHASYFYFPPSIIYRPSLRRTRHDCIALGRLSACPFDRTSTSQNVSRPGLCCVCSLYDWWQGLGDSFGGSGKKSVVVVVECTDCFFRSSTRSNSPKPESCCSLLTRAKPGQVSMVNSTRISLSKWWGYKRMPSGSARSNRGEKTDGSSTKKSVDLSATPRQILTPQNNSSATYIIATTQQT